MPDESARADAIELLEEIYWDQIQAWGKLAKRTNPTIYVVFVTAEQRDRIVATHAGDDMPSPIVVTDGDDLDVARETWDESMSGWATHGPSDERTIAILLPRL